MASTADDDLLVHLQAPVILINHVNILKNLNKSSFFYFTFFGKMHTVISNSA